MGTNWVIFSVVAVYLLIMLGISWYSKQKITNNTDFMLAGRRLGPFLAAGALAATEIGGGSSLGVVEKAYGDWGMGASWYVLTMALAFIFLTFVGHKFRRSMVKTVPEYFRRRYGKAPGAATAIMMIIPLIGLTASQFIASAAITSVMLNLNYKTAVVVVAIFVTAYSVIGGMWSITLTDIIQVFLIVFGMALAVPFALHTLGGWQQAELILPPEKLRFFNGDVTPTTVISLLVMYIATFTVGQENVSRYYSARDDKTARIASLMASGVNLLFAFIPTVLGLIMFALVSNGSISEQLLLQNGSRYALPVLAVNTMPSLIVGLLFAAIISATMSSADSDMLGAGSIFSNDLYKIYIRPQATDLELMRVTKITMIIVGFIGMVIALTNTRSLIQILAFSFTLRAAGSFFPYVLGHYWKKASPAGALLAIIFGSVITLTIELYNAYFTQHPFSLFGFKEPILPGLLASLLVFVIFSRLFPAKNESLSLKDE
jgi:SSS family solute:Na+ symporter